jgi:hypothetical protein
MSGCSTLKKYICVETKQNAHKCFIDQYNEYRILVEQFSKKHSFDPIRYERMSYYGELAKLILSK